MSAVIKERRRAALAGVQRELIIEGFAEAIGEKGYQATTIADIAGAAHVSKSTFYEHFADKEAVFLALHATVEQAMLSWIGRAHAQTAAESDWRTRIRRITTSYLNGMADNPAFLRQVMTEAAAASPATREARDTAFERFADRLTGLTEEIAETTPGLRPLRRPLAIAALGGILELFNRAAPHGPDAVRALAPDAGDLLIRLIEPAPAA